MGLWKWILGLRVIGTVSEYGIARYSFSKTVLRSNAERERTMKMAGTNWGDYIPNIRACREWLEARECEDVSVVSGNGLRLVGSYYPAAGARYTVLCFHGYTSKRRNGFPCITESYLEQRHNVLLVDKRTHGRNEGIYIGFGRLDRYDMLTWLGYLLARFGTEQEFILHGMSMGGTTVLTSSGLSLPPQVRGVMSDCGFTSAWDVLTLVLCNIYHTSAFPVIQMLDRMAREKAGYGLAEYSAVEEAREAKVPILFIHGDADTFVPGRMRHELYDACTSGKSILAIEGAAHAEAYHKDAEAYEGTLERFLNELEKKED